MCRRRLKLNYCRRPGLAQGRRSPGRFLAKCHGRLGVPEVGAGSSIVMSLRLCRQRIEAALSGRRVQRFFHARPRAPDPARSGCDEQTAESVC
ncbi:hypothetical protein EVAR_11202_1 [Eumeta japonica]|uniref:Uncharacterized protein n=1 Tax=Eumeta variegata TaxID=151549 RepID=A0A4C1U4D7_EUMVA|nr:hypothetical protein EVAR_11202_1 [Eumeta japonica]